MEKEEAVDDDIAEDKDNQSMVEFKDLLKENYKLKREIIFIKQQLLEKDKKMKKMEFMFGYKL